MKFLKELNVNPISKKMDKGYDKYSLSWNLHINCSFLKRTTHWRYLSIILARPLFPRVVGQYGAIILDIIAFIVQIIKGRHLYVISILLRTNWGASFFCRRLFQWISPLFLQEINRLCKLKIGKKVSQVIVIKKLCRKNGYATTLSLVEIWNKKNSKFFI